MQTINLKKAHKLVKQIKETIGTIVLTGTVDLSVYADNDVDSISQVLANKRAELNNNYNRYLGLTNLLYRLRNSIGQANAQSGINDSLNTLSNYEEILNKVVRLKKDDDHPFGSSVDTNTDPVVISRKLEAFKAQTSVANPYSRHDSVTVSLSADSVSPQYIAQLKKQKSDIEDTILSLNLQNTVVLSDQDVADLQQENIL